MSKESLKYLLFLKLYIEVLDFENFQCLAYFFLVNYILASLLPAYLLFSEPLSWEDIGLLPPSEQNFLFLEVTNINPVLFVFD